jgi:hypothetical protein
VKYKLKYGATMVVNNGENTQFWEDAWAGAGAGGGTPLKLSFPKLYEYSRDKSCLVSECYDEGIRAWILGGRLLRRRRCNRKL